MLGARELVAVAVVAVVAVVARNSLLGVLEQCRDADTKPHPQVCDRATEPRVHAVFAMGATRAGTCDGLSVPRYGIWKTEDAGSM